MMDEVGHGPRGYSLCNHPPSLVTFTFEYYTAHTHTLEANWHLLYNLHMNIPAFEMSYQMPPTIIPHPT